MRLLRFRRQPLRGLVILIEQFPTFLRLSWICMAASLLGGAVSDRHVWLGGITDLLARGVFAVAWIRAMGLGENSGRPAYFRLGRREVFVALAWMLAEVFITFPANVVATSLAIATGIPIHDAAMPLLALAHFALGAAYLLPVDAAMESGLKGWRAPDLIMRGGVKTGAAALLAWLPANLLLEGARLLPNIELVDGFGLQAAAMTLIHYLAMALTAGTITLIWLDLVGEDEA